MEVLICLLSVTFLFTMSAAATQEQFMHTVPMGIDEDRYLQLLSRVENLEKRDQEQQVDIHMLRSELYTEKQKTSRLEAKITWLIQDRSKNADDDMGTTVGDKGSLNQDSDIINNTNENVTDTRYGKIPVVPTPRIRRQEHMPVIAFHATLTNDKYHTGAQQSIAFDHAITNIGVAYNPHYGVFVAPVPGVYVFSTTILVHGNIENHCSIVKNGVSAANLYLRDENSLYDSESATVVLHLEKGDDVAVQNMSADKFINGGYYSMFSGFLLQKDQPSETIIGKK